jgi:quercetin dioxygenase-like cupin family protein
MQSTEEIIEHSYLGERIEFVEAPQKEAESCIVFYHHMFWKGSGYLPEHIHPHHDEIFEVVKGRAQYYIKGKRYKARAGSFIFIPKGHRHINPYNAWFTELVLKKKDADTFRSDDFYKQLYNMTDNQKRSGRLNIIQRFRLASLTNGNTVFTPVPGFIQRVIIRLSAILFPPKNDQRPG